MGLLGLLVALDENLESGFISFFYHIYSHKLYKYWWIWRGY